MSEKRFKLAYEKGNEAIFEDLDHPYPRRMTNKEVENLLNEQQSAIQSLKEENEQLKKEKAKLIERLRECGMRLDRLNCR